MNALDRAAALRAAIILLCIASFEGAFVCAYPQLWIGATLHRAGEVGPFAWLLCGAIALAYVVYSVRGLPVIGRLLPRVSPVKILAPIIAVPSSIVEEVFFRSSLMDSLAARHQPISVQIIVSAVAFGAVHAAWGIRGGWRALRGAMGSTTLLGVGLAVLYLAAGRIVFPCVVAHCAINLILEPWLLYAYIVRVPRRAPT